MPPNVKGGKGYRKGKHATMGEAKMLEWNTADGQMLGRTMKKLGDRRFRVFCNDNKERICKLTGSMRKSEWVDESAIVLISSRVLGNATMSANQEIGDILSVVDTRLYGKLRKMDGINPLLFTNIENDDDGVRRSKVESQKAGEQMNDDFFECGSESESDSEELTEEEKKERVRAREAVQKERDQLISSRRAMKTLTNDIDIDAI
jgi:translation initiation factor IF-1